MAKNISADDPEWRASEQNLENNFQKGQAKWEARQVRQAEAVEKRAAKDANKNKK